MNAEAENQVVHVIDDDHLVRGALDSLFRSAGLVPHCYPSAMEFLEDYSSSMSGCVVLDVRLPGMSGLDLQTEMMRRGVKLPIVFMTGHGDVPMSVQGMKAGAVNFLGKPFRDQEMLDAVGEAFLLDRKRRIIENQNLNLVTRFATLSKREREVVELVTAGKMNKQAAFDLGLSEISVKIYRGSAMRKMDIRTLADLVKGMETIRLSRVNETK